MLASQTTWLGLITTTSPPEMMESHWTAVKPGLNIVFHNSTQTAEMLVQKSAEFNIDLNAKDYLGWTPFHFACFYNCTKTAEMLLQKSTEFNIDLNTKDYVGRTPFNSAWAFDHKGMLDILVQKSAEFNVELDMKLPNFSAKDFRSHFFSIAEIVG